MDIPNHSKIQSATSPCLLSHVVGRLPETLRNNSEILGQGLDLLREDSNAMWQYLQALQNGAPVIERRLNFLRGECKSRATGEQMVLERIAALDTKHVRCPRRTVDATAQTDVGY